MLVSLISYRRSFAGLRSRTRTSTKLYAHIFIVSPLSASHVSGHSILRCALWCGLCGPHAQPINTCLLVLYRIYFLSLKLHAFAISAKQQTGIASVFSVLCPMAMFFTIMFIHQCRRSSRSKRTVQFFLLFFSCSAFILIFFFIRPSLALAISRSGVTRGEKRRRDIFQQ